MRAAFNWPNSIAVNSLTTHIANNSWLTTEVDALPRVHLLPTPCVHTLISLPGGFGSTG